MWQLLYDIPFKIFQIKLHFEHKIQEKCSQAIIKWPKYVYDQVFNCGMSIHFIHLKIEPYQHAMYVSIYNTIPGYEMLNKMCNCETWAYIREYKYHVTKLLNVYFWSSEYVGTEFFFSTKNNIFLIFSYFFYIALFDGYILNISIFNTKVIKHYIWYIAQNWSLFSGKTLPHPNSCIFCCCCE